MNALKKLMSLLAAQNHNNDQQTWERRLKAIYYSGSVLGPEAVGLGIRILAIQMPPGKERNHFLCQADNAFDDMALMKNKSRVDPIWIH